jgi:hypothetical protein
MSEVVTETFGLFAEVLLDKYAREHDLELIPFAKPDVWEWPHYGTTDRHLPVSDIATSLNKGSHLE